MASISKDQDQFKSIISARRNDGRPSDLEFLLRCHCQKLKVVRKLSGAHLLIKMDHSVAVRAYFSHDLQDFIDNRKESIGSGGSYNEENCDYDEMSAFLKAFKVAIVFFVLPDVEQQRRQLDDPSSFFQRAQNLVQQMAHSGRGKIVRIHLVSTAAKAVEILHSFSKACLPSSMEKKRHYFAERHKHFFLPRPKFIPVSSHPNGAQHVREAVMSWADRMDFPPNEADVLRNMMNNLQTVATANGQVLHKLPLDARTKKCMMQFFGACADEEQAAAPSEHIGLDAQSPASSLTFPDVQRMMHSRQQEQHRIVPNNRLQVQQSQAYQQPHSSPEYYEMPDPNQRMAGIPTFATNPSNRTLIQHENSSFAQYSDQGIMPVRAQLQASSTPYNRSALPTRNVYRQAILTAAPLPPSNTVMSSFCSQMPIGRQFQTQQQPQQNQNNGVMQVTQVSHSHPQVHSLAYPPSPFVATSQNNVAGNPNAMLTSTPYNQRMRQYQSNDPVQPLTTPTQHTHPSNMPRMVSDRRNPQSIFPPRRPRRFVPEVNR